MPLHLPPITRRRFICALGATVALPWPSKGATVDEDLVAILNDTHIGGKQKPDAPIVRNLQATVAELIAMNPRPAAVLINGDLALRDGQPEDYTHFEQLIQPLREAGLPVHLTMGNHDARDVFYRVLAREKPDDPPVLERHVGIVSTRHAHFFLLDSLRATMIAEGDLGEAQLGWLAEALAARADRPAIIVAHHNPRLGGDPAHFPGGLVDSAPLWELFARQRQVKAYIHGHIHAWGLAAHEGVHIANTPAVSYVADTSTSTIGWTLARLRPDGMTLTTRTHLETHPLNRQSHELRWRS